MSRTWWLCACVLGALGVSAGCQKPVNFPVCSEAQAAAKAGAVAAYDGNHDGKVDFFLFAAADGRIETIGYDRDGDGAVDERISLDAIPLATARHVVLLLDGYGYDVVKAYRDAGGLRLFHAPSRVIAPYPTLTDLCLEDALGYIPCRAFEAEYYDRRSNRLAGGNWDYLTGANEPYNRLLDYRAAAIWDAIGYLYPREVFGKELNDAKRKFDRAQGREFLAYFVSSAGISTAYGAAGQRQSLAQLERLILQVLYESRG
ncbi:MAG TPA: hypothetical protein PK082_04620, partial [Phycisphaerae bacterium]|nr:hypothetical protein [Phycisphaerae bacterium]